MKRGDIGTGNHYITEAGRIIRILQKRETHCLIEEHYNNKIRKGLIMFASIRQRITTDSHPEEFL